MRQHQGFTSQSSLKGNDSMSNSDIITKFCNGCKTNKEFDLFSKCSSGKYGLSSQCKACYKLYYQSKKHEIDSASKIRTAAWRLKNQEKYRAYSIEYYQKHTEKIKAKSAKYQPLWRAKNPGKTLALTRKYQISKINACPPWINLSEIEKIYDEAAKIRKNGIDVHVDHIIPLRGKMVCGLHVPWNLRIIPAKDNMKKNAKMPESCDFLAFVS